MALEKTQAVVLKSFNWSESSRTVSFFSREFGRLALIDKGGRRLSSKRGRVLPFAVLEITFYSSKKETSGYISDIELIKAFSLSGDGSLGRLAYASAACELLYLLLPVEEPQEELFDYFTLLLERLDSAGKTSLPALFLSFLVRLLSQMGYHPSLGYCVACGRDAEAVLTKGTSVPFLPERGGIICQSCQTAGDSYIGLPYEAFDKLLALQMASLNEAEKVLVKFNESTVLLDALVKFLEYQAEIDPRIKSLEFLEKLKNTQLTVE